MTTSVSTPVPGQECVRSVHPRGERLNHWTALPRGPTGMAACYG